MIVVEVNQQSGKKMPLKFWRDQGQKVSQALKVKSRYEVSLGLVSPAAIKKLNQVYRGKNKVTNVLSFSEADTKIKLKLNNTVYLGEIIICYQQAELEATGLGRTVSQQLEFLFTHGVLHLLGYDHATKKQAEQMEKLEARILQTRG